MESFFSLFLMFTDMSFPVPIWNNALSMFWWQKVNLLDLSVIVVWLIDLPWSIVAENYMKVLAELNGGRQIDYSEVYRQYLANLYHMSTKIRLDQSATGCQLPGAKQMSPTMKDTLWSPAKLLEMESNRSDDESSSGTDLECLFPNLSNSTAWLKITRFMSSGLSHSEQPLWEWAPQIISI